MKHKKNDDFKRYFKPFTPKVNNSSFATQKAENASFNATSDLQICQAIQLLINELDNRGIKITNWDDKTKFISQLQFINNKIFFLEDNYEE